MEMFALERSRRPNKAEAGKVVDECAGRSRGADSNRSRWRFCNEWQDELGEKLMKEETIEFCAMGKIWAVEKVIYTPSKHAVSQIDALLKVSAGYDGGWIH